MKANQELYEDMVELGITRMGERPDHILSDNEFRHFTCRIYTWITLYDNPICDILNPLAIAFYNLSEKVYYIFHPFAE
jgi:hypothetical protein